MEDNNKLFVFEKKEVVLIFIFIILIAIIAFTLGVRTGKQLSLKHDEFIEEDIQNINLKSVDEEYVEGVIQEKETSGFEESMEGAAEEDKQTDDSIESRLREEMEKLATEEVKISPVPKAKSPTKEVIKKNVETGAREKSVDEYSGKYTIQLFSHQSKAVAEEFADGFIIKGHDVLINEVVIPGKGKWYRVGIGSFKNVHEAEKYLQKEKALFQDNKYIIQKI